MNIQLIDELHQLNPWLKNPEENILQENTFIPRAQLEQLLDEEWDRYWTILVGPRRAGKTTLGRYLAKQLVQTQRFSPLLYLNCDYLSIRNWLKSPTFVSEALKTFNLQSPILFIDEVQRLENPGLLLKAIIDLNLPLKHIATGSSQLEIKSKVQEFLTGRQLTSLILPLSHEEWEIDHSLDHVLIYGCYPQVVLSQKKEIQLTEIYNRYIQKDIVEILKVGHPDIFKQLLTLIAHHSGQLVNYNQLATDCKVSTTMIRNQLNILEQTFVIAKVMPFVGNKRSEVTHNPIYYFIDNGFRNVALRNFSGLLQRSDMGLLVEEFVLQEIFKLKAQHYYDFDIHFWRTKSGAEVDFVVYKNQDQFVPLEVKYRSLKKPTISRGVRSFIDAYKPRIAIMITKDFLSTLQVNNCMVYFVPLRKIAQAISLIKNVIDHGQTGSAVSRL